MLGDQASGNRKELNDEDVDDERRNPRARSHSPHPPLFFLPPFFLGL